MPSKLPRSLAVFPLALLLANWSGATLAAQVNLEKWHLIRILDPVARHAAIAALEAAAVRLGDSDCKKVLTDFKNGDGSTLAGQLSSLGVDIHAYFGMITFIDDTRHRRCESGAGPLPLQAAASCVYASTSSSGSRATTHTSSSPCSSTRSCTRWGSARTRHRPGRSPHASSLDAEAGRRGRAPTRSETPSRGTETRRCCLRAAEAN